MPKGGKKPKPSTSNGSRVDSCGDTPIKTNVNMDNDSMDPKKLCRGSEEGGGGNVGQKMLSSLSLSTEKVEETIKQESVEFAFLQPVCAQVLQDPSEQNLKILEERLEAVGTIPVLLSDFVTFPFAIHLKVIKNYKEPQRLLIYKTFAKLLQKTVLRDSYDMFENVFQKLTLGLTNPKDMSTVNESLSEAEMDAILECIEGIVVVSLPHHMDALCTTEKEKILGHLIFILLQLVSPKCGKSVRLRALDTLTEVINLCNGINKRANVLFKFLPGIVSNMRRLSSPSTGQTVKAIALKAIVLMGKTIRISTEFVKSKEKEQADNTLGRIVDLLGKELILSSDVDYRRSFLELCSEIAVRSDELPCCTPIIAKILLQLREDNDDSISNGCIEVLNKLGIVATIKFEDLAILLQTATNHLRSDNDDGCVLALREVAGILTTKRLSHVEFKAFMELVFDHMNELVWKYRLGIKVDFSRVTEPVFDASVKLCKSLVTSSNIDEMVFEFSEMLSELQNTSKPVKRPTGVICTLNAVLTELLRFEPPCISEFGAAQIAEAYLALIDMQSTEVVLSNVSSGAPAMQISADIRRAYLLQGLGLIGKKYTAALVPIILYPLIEHAGSNYSELVNEAAENCIKSIAAPSNVSEFLTGNVTVILNEVGVRMLNLSLYPNCPNALIFLSQYFDFSEDTFSDFIEKTFEQCSDKFGGGDVQHVYAKVYYALLKSISTHFAKSGNSSEIVEAEGESQKSLLQRLLEYQKAIGVTHPSVQEENVEEVNADDFNMQDESTGEQVETENDEEEKLDPVHNLVLRISHRVLNFLPNEDRSVRLVAMDSLILGLPVLKSHENAILPLAHTIWQNLIPRFDEKDFVTVRKAFELLKTLCVCCGGFLKKRTIEEAFPRLSTLLFKLARDAELVSNKNRQFYTYTQAYKLQLAVLQGMALLIENIDVQEFELDKIVSGCVMYLNPEQHKNLRDAAVQLLDAISSGKHCRTVWMKMIACGIQTAPESIPHPEFVSLPDFTGYKYKCALSSK